MALKGRLQRFDRRLRYFCSPYYQDSALYPFIAQLERAAGFARDDGPEAKLDKLETLLGPGAGIGDVSLLVELLSLPGGERFPPLDLIPPRRKERTLAALLRQLERLARQQPVLMIFEDLHWTDPTSREFLDLVLERVDHLPVLLVATFRPEFQPPWAGLAHVTMILLNRLGRSDGAAMIQRLAGNAALLPQDVIAEIVERTDGVPLFVEEVTKAVLEAGAERGRDVAASVPSTGLGVPATLQASLMARLDRLGPAAKGVAQIGAAIGREFSYELAASVGEVSEERLQEALLRLVDAGLVFQRGAPPTAEYLFKHALVQDTAYGTLLRRPRQQLHARIAEALEAHSPELIDSQPELLAQHYAEAGLVEKSVAFWGKAGRRSAARSAMAEAAAQLQKGLDQLALLPETPERQREELEFWSALGAVLRAVKGQAAPETGDVIAEIVERTDGVPLFVEEVTKAVLEAGAERGRDVAASVPSTGLGVPATLQASLMARLDRLGPAAKGVAQIGAAIGREFSYELAASVGEVSEERLQEALLRLVDAGLVFQRGAPPTAEYLFKHALVQDTAYGTLLRRPRQQLHARIAEALEAHSPS